MKLTEEQRRLIADLYTKGLSAKEIKEKLNISSLSRVYYTLNKLNVNRTNKYEKERLADGRPSVQSLLSEITKDYVDNKMHIKAIARKYGYDYASIYRCLDKNEILKLRPARKSTVYDEYNDFFTRRDSEALYWFGFFLADGGVVRDSTICLILAEKDRNHLEKFAKLIERPIKNGTNGYGHSNVRVTLYSQKAVDDLKHIGLGCKSSYRFPTDASWLNSVDFWRGVIDGDGCLSLNLRKNGQLEPRLNLVGSFEIVSEFKNFLNRNGIVTKAKVSQRGKIWSFTIGTNKARAASKLLYLDNNGISLERKYKIAQQHTSF